MYFRRSLGTLVANAISAAHRRRLCKVILLTMAAGTPSTERMWRNMLRTELYEAGDKMNLVFVASSFGYIKSMSGNAAASWGAYSISAPHQDSPVLLCFVAKYLVFMLSPLWVVFVCQGANATLLSFWETVCGEVCCMLSIGRCPTVP